MKFKSIILSSLAAIAAMPAFAQSSGIFPNPKQETVGETAFTSSTYKIIGEDTAAPKAVNALKGRLTIGAAGAVEIIIGEKGDAAVAAVADQIPEHPQAYVLITEPGKVTIAGSDESGTFYGVQSFLQLAAKGEVPALTVQDWPDMEIRGVIEGYYGNPWSWDDIHDMCEFFDQTKMNTFIYGPKNDAYHHGGGVFTPYPEDQAAELKSIAEKAAEHNIDIVWAMHPGTTLDGDNLERAKAKLEAMYDLGFRAFGVFVDDCWPAVDKVVAFVNYLNENVVKVKGDVEPLILCPSEYNQAWASSANDYGYLRTLGEQLDPSVHIMYTGRAVVDMELSTSSKWFVTKTGRKPYIWHNYPCSDYGSRPLLLCPYEPAAADLYTTISGFTANPMEYYEASKVGLYGMSDFSWNAEAYDPWEAWEESIQYIMPEHADAFRTYCQINFNYPAPKSHGGPIIYQESPDFVQLKAEGALSAETAANYRAYFQKQLDAAQELQGIQDNRLINEIAEWLQYYELQARRGLLMCDILDAIAAADGDECIKLFTNYNELTQQGKNLRSRNFEGTLRVLTPFCGSQFVEPWIESTVASLSNGFRDLGVSYPADLFGQQIIPDGQYYILYKGKYLSNGTGTAGNSPDNPSFKSAIDDVNPNRQIWTIRKDVVTGRFSIVSAQDERYVNEKGDFKAQDDATNPFTSAWHTYTITMLNGQYAIQCGGSAGTNYWSVSSSRLQKSGSNAYAVDNFIFELVPASGQDLGQHYTLPGTYAIANSKGELLTKSGSDGVFKKPSATIKNTQKFTFEQDPTNKLWRITNNDKYPVDQTFKFRSASDYDPLWHTYEIIECNGKISIRNAVNFTDANDKKQENTKYWMLNADETGLTAVDAPGEFEKYCLTLIPLESEDGIAEISAKGAETIYDLQGRRVIAPRSGLYIQFGKIVKF